MINIFRKIRQNLLSGNSAGSETGRVRKYMFYAIGEIFLVVVGILIALSINNWNEHRKERNLNISYLLSIKEDLKQDLKQIEENVASLNAHEEQGLQVRDFLDSKNVMVDAAELAKNFMRLHLFREFSPTKTAYQNLVNNGGIALIKSKSLPNLLTAYHFEAPFNVVGINQRARLAGDYDAFRIKYVKSGVLREYLQQEIYGNSKLRSQDYEVDWYSLRKDKEYRYLLDQILAMRVPQRWRLEVAKKSLLELNIGIDKEIYSLGN